MLVESLSTDEVVAGPNTKEVRIASLEQVLAGSTPIWVIFVLVVTAAAQEHCHSHHPEI